MKKPWFYTKKKHEETLSATENTLRDPGVGTEETLRDPEVCIEGTERTLKETEVCTEETLRSPFIEKQS